MARIRRFPSAIGRRVETAPIQFGDDWPGIFIRGDDALAMITKLNLVASGAVGPVVLRDIARTLESCLVEGK